MSSAIYNKKIILAGRRHDSSGAESGSTAPVPDSGRRAVPRRIRVALGVAVGLAAGLGIARLHAQQLEVIAVVNGKLITQDELNRRLENSGGQAMMRQMATQEMLLQFVKSQGMLPTEKWMDAKMAELRKSPNFDGMLSDLGQTEDDYRQNLQIHLGQAALLSRGLKITDKDVRAFYAKNVDPKNAAAEFYQPESAEISVIVTADQASAMAASTALRVGTPFAEVAAKYSVDTSRANGGALPVILRGRTNSSRVPGLEEFIFGQAVGQTSEPHQFGKTYWIIKCLNRTPMKTLSFDAVKEDCEIGARMAKGMAANGARVQAEFESFQRTSNIQAFSQKYQSAINAH